MKEIEELLRRLRELEEELLSRIRARVQDTRFLSDQDRELILDYLCDGQDFEREDPSVTTRFCVGFSDCTDAELVEEWVNATTPERHESGLWKNHLSNNIAAIAAVHEAEIRKESE